SLSSAHSRVTDLFISLHLSPPLLFYFSYFFFFFNDTAPTEIYTLSLHDALPISVLRADTPVSEYEPGTWGPNAASPSIVPEGGRSEEHTSELQSLTNLVCRLLLEKKKKKTNISN